MPHEAVLLKRNDQIMSNIINQIRSQIRNEEDFLADFLQVNDVALTYADYMALEHYFRRQATQSFELSSTTTKLVRSAVDLIFGFLASDLKSFIDEVCAKDET